MHRQASIRFDSLLQDLRFALRRTRRYPLLTATAVTAVALGVGANTAVVGVLRTVLLNPLGLRDAERVMVARVSIEKLRLQRVSASGVEFREVSAMTDAFSAVAAMEGRAWTSDVGGEPARLVGKAVTADFFRVFGERPLLGRFFAADDAAVVVLSHGLWRSRFGGDASVLDRTLALDGAPHRIVGVAPPEFRFPAGTQAWTPLVLAPDRLARRGWNMNLTVFARLQDGVSESRAVDRVSRYVANLKSAPEGRDLARSGYSIDLDPFPRYVAGDLRGPLWLLWASALVVVLTGCANVAGLLLARVSGRTREIAIRISLGASTPQILRQLLIESAVLGVLGGVAGIFVAALALSGMTRLALPQRELLQLAGLDARLLLYALGLALATGLVFGAAPAVQLLRRSQTSALARSRRRRFQDLFVTAEVAGTLLLVVSTGLLLRSLWAVRAVEAGFDARNLTTAFFMKPKNDPGFADRLTAALRASGAVESAALAYPVPFSGGGLTSSLSIRNRQRQPGEPEWHGEAFMVSPGYLQTLRIPLLRGRDVAESDTLEAPLVCLVDASFARRFFPSEDPLGREISMYRGWARIVGVVGEIRGTTLESPSRPAVYYPLAQVPFFPQAAVVARSRSSAAAPIREAVRGANPGVALYDVRSMEDRVAESLGIRRIVALLLGVFGGLSLLLAAIGLYAVVAQLVGERTQEIGIRMALGARPAQVFAHTMGQGLRSGALGVLLGLAGTIYTERWLRGMLYAIKPFDLPTFAAASAGVLLLLAFAVWWPARRAARIDPHEALRRE